MTSTTFDVSWCHCKSRAWYWNQQPANSSTRPFTILVVRSALANFRKPEQLQTILDNFDILPLRQKINISRSVNRHPSIHLKFLACDLVADQELLRASAEVVPLTSWWRKEAVESLRDRLTNGPIFVKPTATGNYTVQPYAPDKKYLGCCYNTSLNSRAWPVRYRSRMFREVFQ